MHRYIALLRGINVSGKNLIKMDALRQSCASIGFSDIKTYIQSGNIVFNSSESDLLRLETLLAQQIEADFSCVVPVLIRTAEQLKQIVENNPFLKEADKEAAYWHITFLASPPNKSDWQSILDKKQSEEAIYLSEEAVYLYCPNGYGKTKLDNTFLEKKLKTKATTRNGKTCEELVKII